MSGKNIIFDDKNVKKSNFCKNKKVIKIDDIDVNEILVSKKELYGTNKSIKYFIGCKLSNIKHKSRLKVLHKLHYSQRDISATLAEVVFKLMNVQRKTVI